MGFSFLTLAFLQADLAGVPGGDVVASLGYSVGFVVVVLGRQQLFTETTLTATLPVLLRRTRESLVALMRMWAIVLVANLIGTVIFAWLIARAGLFAPPVENALGAIGLEIVSGDFWPKMFKAVLAGWLIALMVWTLPGAGSARLFVIILLTSAVSLGHFPHIVAGATDAAYALFSGRANLSDYAFGFLAPTLLGNTIGGVVLAAILNHAPVAHDIKSKGATAEA
jgi:formate-nitrite transporter family protein